MTRPRQVEARLYLDYALGLLQSQHINGATADWAALRRRPRPIADTATAVTPEQTYPAIRAVIKALGEAPRIPDDAERPRR
ncbi:hypothetical protein ACRAWD_10455 [Caulobacter segnis]